MYYELREYRVRFEASAWYLERFRTEMVGRLERAGFTLIGAWTVEIGDGTTNDLLWLLQWTDLNERQAALARLQAQEGWADYSKGSAPVMMSVSSRILKPTEFSPLA